MKANAVVFVGPSLPLAEARAELDALYLGPAGQGDVYRAAKERPHAIAIIDGYFERVPAVWHKEILWALAHGVHVFGGASMGALRAAELASFGMQGVGAIYEAFRLRELEDDDEVAVAHGDASTSFRPTSEAMVNIRATLAHAEASGVLTAGERATLQALAKDTFYPERSYPGLLAAADARGIAKDTVERLRDFVRRERVDQKQRDAREVLRAVRECVMASTPPKPVAFSFAHTEAWDQVVTWAEAQAPITSEAEVERAELLLAEARSAGARGALAIERALGRSVAGLLARRSRATPSAEVLAELDTRVRASAALESADDFSRWLVENQLSPETYGDFLSRQATLEWMRARYAADRALHVADELRSSGDFAKLWARARAKQNLLSERGLENPTLDDAGVGEAELARWYCEERLGRPVPRDRRGFLLELGLPDWASFEREALRELLYSRLGGGSE